MRKAAIIDPVGIKAGLEHYDISLLSHLADEGTDVMNYSNFLTDDHTVVSYKTFSETSGSGWFMAYRYLSGYKRSLDLCRKNHVTHLIFHVFHFNAMDEWILRYARRKGFRLILIVHDVESFIRRTNTGRLVKICVHLANHVVVHNRFTFQELCAFLPSGVHEKVHVIPHGNFIALDDRETPGHTARKILNWDERVKVLFFGMIKPTKGLDLLLVSWKKVNPEVSLHIAGRLRKDRWSVYENLINKMPQDAISTEIGYINPDRRSLLFKAADIVVIPYRRIYQSGVLLMAMSFGLPVIVSDLPANKDCVKDGVSGMVFRSGDPDELSSCINRLAGDREMRKKLGDTARQEMEENHNWKTIANSFSSLLD
ncbi:MAG: glycosyltransferase family 4 protein [Bacteroidia bacterium]|nr:glycosyltransferase family 4 protein [Bacteroidia bacterium]